MRRVITWLVLLSAVAAWAAPAALAQVPAPTVTRTRLTNGLVVLVRENPTAPVVAVNLMIGSGVRAETRQIAGVSNLLQLMVVRGTNTKDGTQIVEAAEQLGGTIESFGEVDAAEIAATALSRHWRDIMALVADVVLNPTLPDGTIVAVKDFLQRQIRNRAERPFEAGVDALRARAFGDHPYAWNPLGLTESVSRLDRAALIAHYRRHYVAGGMVLAVSGRVKSAEVAAEAQKLFAEVLTGTPPAMTRPAPPAPAASRDVLTVPGAQAQILMGGFAPTLTEPDHAAVKVLAAVLGGGMAGRFFSELRDKQGLAYTTAMSYPSRLEHGFIQAQIGTAPENVDRAEAALRKELERIQREPLGDTEFGVAKAYLLGSLAMDRRTNARQAWYLAAYELAGVGHEHLDGYLARVRAVTAADVQRVAQRYLATLRTVVVRPPAR